MPAAKKSKPSTKTTFVVKKAKKSFKKNNKFYDAKAMLPEVKQLNWTPNTTLSSTGIVPMNSLVACSNGTTLGSRIGQKISVISIEYKIVCSLATASLASVAAYPTNENFAKMVLVYDKQPNGAAPTWGDVFDNTGASATVSLRKPDGFDRFEILAEETCCFNAAERNAVYWNRYVPMKKQVQYNGANLGNVTDVKSGNFVIMAADENGSGASLTEFYGCVRVRFVDE